MNFDYGVLATPILPSCGFQNKVLCAILDTPFYVSNEVIQHDMPLESIKQVKQLNVCDINEVRKLKPATRPDYRTKINL